MIGNSIASLVLRKMLKDQITLRILFRFQMDNIVSFFPNKANRQQWEATQ